MHLLNTIRVQSGLKHTHTHMANTYILCVLVLKYLCVVNSVKIPFLIQSDTSCEDNRRKLMDTVFKCDQHERLVDQGNRKFSHRALKGAILIHAYRHEKRYALANRILDSLVDIDTLMSKWRCEYTTYILAVD